MHIRHVMEYEFHDVVGPLLERRVTDRHVPVSSENCKLLKELDDLLQLLRGTFCTSKNKSTSRGPTVRRYLSTGFDIMSADEQSRHTAVLGIFRLEG